MQSHGIILKKNSVYNRGTMKLIDTLVKFQMYILTLPIKVLERTVGGNDILIRVHINYIVRFCTRWEQKKKRRRMFKWSILRKNSKNIFLNMDNHCV